jgi:hypothetical protein
MSTAGAKTVIAALVETSGTVPLVYVKGLVDDSGQELVPGTAAKNLAILQGCNQPGTEYWLPGPKNGCYFALPSDFNQNIPGTVFNGMGSYGKKNPGASCPTPGNVYGTMFGPCVGGAYTTSPWNVTGKDCQVRNLSVTGTGDTTTNPTEAPRAFTYNGIGERIQFCTFFGGSAITVEDQGGADDTHLLDVIINGQWSGLPTVNLGQVAVGGVAHNVPMAGMSTVTLTSTVAGVVPGSPVLEITNPTSKVPVSTSVVSSSVVGGVTVLVLDTNVTSLAGDQYLIYAGMGWRTASPDCIYDDVHAQFAPVIKQGADWNDVPCHFSDPGNGIPGPTTTVLATGPTATLTPASISGIIPGSLVYDNTSAAPLGFVVSVNNLATVPTVTLNQAVTVGADTLQFTSVANVTLDSSQGGIASSITLDGSRGCMALIDYIRGEQSWVNVNLLMGLAAGATQSSWPVVLNRSLGNGGLTMLPAKAPNVNSGAFTALCVYMGDASPRDTFAMIRFHNGTIAATVNVAQVFVTVGSSANPPFTSGILYNGVLQGQVDTYILAMNALPTVRAALN